MSAPPRVRKPIDKLTKSELDTFVRAWRGIQQRPPENPQSHFKLAGYHGEPFRGAGWGTSAYWGGYCNHGNVLFPTWHRVYLYELENALRSVEGCHDVTLPYWDEVAGGGYDDLPKVLTDEKYVLQDGPLEEIDNPLYSYVLQRNIVDHRSDKPAADYSKPKDYRTVRYPLSGLVGTEEDRKKTEAHNKKWAKDATKELNANVITWLTDVPKIKGVPVPRWGYVANQYRNSLLAPNYTVFSNTTSRAEWNDNNPPAVSLESPHNAIHLALGGFEVGKRSASPIPGANGDMGENETASFDPIFYLHHAFVDLVFWKWQELHGCKDQLEIFDEYPGTNTVDSQGPTPGTAPNSWLDMGSPLNPFRRTDSKGVGVPYTSLDCVNIETQLGYTYENSSLDELLIADAADTATPRAAIYVSGIDRTKIKGSFVISAFVNDGTTRHNLDNEAVLSRWHVDGCANCQNHLLSSATFPIPDALLDDNGRVADNAVTLEVGITTHTEPATENLQALTSTDPTGVFQPALAYTTIAGDEVEAPLRAELRPVPTAD